MQYMQNGEKYWLWVVVATIAGHYVFQILNFSLLSYPIIVLYSLTGGNVSIEIWTLFFEIPLLAYLIHYLFRTIRPKMDGVFMVTLLVVSMILVLFLIPSYMRQLEKQDAKPGSPMLINGEVYIQKGGSLERINQ